MSTLTKAEIIDSIVAHYNLPRKIAEDFTIKMFELIRDTLEAGEEVKIPGFGNFYVKDKKERVGRNPKTKEEYMIAARRVVGFKAGRKLRDILNNQ